ncbi:hypothetical protein HK098_001316 [Nowakowskiella sp. JEL0407]|nr:hypothetical protein HK098_001316 [Nowakowskiella sp. JEL0407]
MGLFSFMFKVGLGAYAYDWWTRRRLQEQSSEPSANSKHCRWPDLDEVTKTFSDSAKEATNAAHENFPKFINRARELYRQQAECGTIRYPNYYIDSADATKSVIQVEVPGIKRDNLTLSIPDADEAVLRVSSTPVKVREGCERGLDAFIKLPGGVDVNGKISAKLEDGVLKIEVPKVVEKKRVVEVK